jgi:acyl transferase domain-containing protein
MSETPDSRDHEIRLKKALLAMQQMRIRLDSFERAKSEPIAIVGMACRFPGAENPQAYWDVLRNGVDAISEVPAGRWDLKKFYDSDPSAIGKMYTRHGGFLSHVDTFDAEFFGIAPREAVAMDPQQRLLLELSWEALEAAGQAPEALVGSRTGVYVGISTSDYAQYHVNSGETAKIDAYSGTGVALSVAAGRVSYVYGLQGPNVAVDTFCSSSLVALHMACRGLRQQECNMALAGGVNLILSPAGTVYSCKVRALAADGRCKTFDAAADGYVRGEGCGVLVLKRLSDATASGDRILAVIRGTAINHDGRSSGLTVPNGLAQQAVIRAAMADGGVDSADVSYVEAHGTGTPLGDPIELRALAAAAGDKRTKSDPLIVGSAKTNIGHLEAAAGVAGVMKVALALQHREIPAHLHLKDPNPLIPWEDLPVRVPRTAMEWNPSTGRRVAGVSSFGFSGTNAHVILEEAPEQAAVARQAHAAYVLPLSARHPEALEALVLAWRNMLAAQPSSSLHDLCYTAAVRRSHHEYRKAFVASSVSELAAALGQAAGDRSALGEGLVFRCGDDLPGAVAQAALWKSLGVEPEAVTGTGGDDLAAACGVPFWTATPQNFFEIDLRSGVEQEAARLYAAGFAIDWRGLYSDGGAVVELPSYPWRKRRFWVEDTGAIRPHSSAARPVVHPLLGRRVLSPALEKVVFESELSTSSPAYLAEHVVHEKVLMPGSAFVEMALAAGREVLGKSAQVRELAIREALVLAEDRAITMQTIVTGGDVEIFSLDGATWKLHAAGNLSDGAAAASAVAVFGELPHTIGIDEFYRLAGGLGLEYGPAFRGITGIRWSDTEIVADIHAAAGSEYLLHPAMLDACLQTLGAKFLMGDAAGEPFLPVAFNGVRFFSAPQEQIQCRVKLHPTDAPDMWEAEMRLINPDGRVAAEIERVICKRAARAQEAPSDRRYVVDWRAKESNFADEQGEPGTWLVFADRTGVADALCALLERREQRCVPVTAGSVYAMEDGRAVVNCRRPDDFRQLLQDAAAHTGLPVRGVAHLWPLDTATSDVAAQMELLCASALHAVQAVARARFTDAPRFCIVTRGAGEGAPLHASLAGLGRIIKVEQPNLRPVVIDLDPQGETRVEAQLIYEELMARDVEDQVALRQGVRYVPRLLRDTAAAPGRMPIRGDATYLITGGTGALGLQTAEWLVRKGARNLALVNRSAISNSAAKSVAQLEAQGAKVAVVSADVSRAEEVAELLANLAESMPPLRGVIHAAGSLDDGLLLQQTWERFERVLAPKVLGAWNLHQQTLGTPLDFFVLFSSATALLGSAGQSSYAAGNGFLDGLAALRRASGLAGTSIAWGAWDGAGMAARLGERERRLWADQGIEALRPADALEELGRLLESPNPVTAVLAVDWTKFVKQYPTGGESPVLSELAREARLKPQDDDESAERVKLLRQLEAAPPAERLEILADFVRGLVAAVLGYDASSLLDPNQGFFEIGMDSLMAVDLQRRLQTGLGVTLSTTVGFDHPTVEALARHLAEKALNFQTPLARSAAAGRGAAASREAARLEQMSEDELLELFAEELEKIDEGRPA